MKSPFPGMDPYLERRWGDVHGGLIFCIKESLQGLLPRGLRARGEQDLLLEDVDDEDQGRLFRGDVALVEGSFPERNRQRSEAGAAAVLEPVVLRYQSVEQRPHRWVQIVDADDNSRVVTVIEVLSPGNKLSGKLNEKYRRKLSDYSDAGVNIVEIDLLRSRRNRLRVRSEDIPPSRRAEYYACVNFARDPAEWIAYPISLRLPLPAIPVPCRESDPPVQLPLQDVLDRVYHSGGHDDIDYTKPPEPPFGEADAAWAAECVKAARG